MSIFALAFYAFEIISKKNHHLDESQEDFSIFSSGNFIA
jgi:hypothetical protein